MDDNGGSQGTSSRNNRYAETKHCQKALFCQSPMVFWGNSNSNGTLNQISAKIESNTDHIEDNQPLYIKTKSINFLRDLDFNNYTSLLAEW